MKTTLISTHRCWRENLYLLTALETWCLLPRVDSTMCSASMPSKRTDWPSSSKYDYILDNKKKCMPYFPFEIQIYVINGLNCCLINGQIRDTAQDPCGRLSFTKEPRTYRSLTHNAICNLNITLPTYSKVSLTISQFVFIVYCILIVKYL